MEAVSALRQLQDPGKARLGLRIAFPHVCKHLDRLISFRPWLSHAFTLPGEDSKQLGT